VTIQADKITRIEIETETAGRTGRWTGNVGDGRQKFKYQAAKRRSRHRVDAIAPSESRELLVESIAFGPATRREPRVFKEPRKANKWLEELVRDAYLASSPHQRICSQNGRTSSHEVQRALDTAIGAEGPWRGQLLPNKEQRRNADRLLPHRVSRQKCARRLPNNPSLELISVEKLTPEMFIPYDASPQESLDMADETPGEKAGVIQ